MGIFFSLELKETSKKNSMEKETKRLLLINYLLIPFESISWYFFHHHESIWSLLKQSAEVCEQQNPDWNDPMMGGLDAFDTACCYIFRKWRRSKETFAALHSSALMENHCPCVSLCALYFPMHSICHKIYVETDTLK